MLDPETIFIVQPKTPEEVDAIADDIWSLVQLIPGQSEDYMEAIREFPHYIRLIYHLEQPVGYIKIGDSDGYDWLGKDSFDFAGAALPEYSRQGLTQLVAPKVIRQAFKNSKKIKMLARVSPDNQPARHAMNALGFRHIGKAGANLLYKLNRKDALA